MLRKAENTINLLFNMGACEGRVQGAEVNSHNALKSVVSQEYSKGNPGRWFCIASASSCCSAFLGTQIHKAKLIQGFVPQTQPHFCTCA